MRLPGTNDRFRCAAILSNLPFKSQLSLIPTCIYSTILLFSSRIYFRSTRPFFDMQLASASPAAISNHAYPDAEYIHAVCTRRPLTRYHRENKQTNKIEHPLSTSRWSTCDIFVLCPYVLSLHHSFDRFGDGQMDGVAELSRTESAFFFDSLTRDAIYTVRL